MSNRIDTMFAKCKSENKKALIAYVTAGFPTLSHSEKLIEDLVKSGVDLIEVGVPFSDPMADGPVIQAAGEVALAQGVKFAEILDMVERLRTKFETPMILFSYCNVLFNYGIEKLAKKCSEIGIDGCLSVDIPFEEQEMIKPAFEKYNLYSIPLLSPATSIERAKKILAEAKGFVYYITVKGVTGARAQLPSDLADILASIREISPIPVVAGFGISSPEMAKEVASHAEGVVCGSAIIKKLQEASSPDEGVKAATEFVVGLREAL